MAESIVTQFMSLLNHQVNSHQNLATYFSKIEALVQVALKNDTFPGVLAHDYLWVLSDIVSQARELNEDALSSLLKIPGTPTLH